MFKSSCSFYNLNKLWNQGLLFLSMIVCFTYLKFEETELKYSVSYRVPQIILNSSQHIEFISKYWGPLNIFRFSQFTEVLSINLVFQNILRSSQYIEVFLMYWGNLNILRSSQYREVTPHIEILSTYWSLLNILNERLKVSDASDAICAIFFIAVIFFVIQTYSYFLQIVCVFAVFVRFYMFLLILCIFFANCVC